MRVSSSRLRMNKKKEVMRAIFENIKHAFGALWGFRARGESFEVITPFPTSTDMYVSVFITVRDGRYVVTDGGWVDKVVYHCSLPTENNIYNRVFAFFEEDYCISRTTSADGFMYLYKSTRDERLIPNLVFDVAYFISAVVNTALVQYRDETVRDRFRTKAGTLIRRHVSADRLRFNAPVSPLAKAAHFGAVVTSLQGNSVSLVNFISGSNYENVRGSFAKSNFNYDLLERTSASRLVRDKILLIDDRHIAAKELSPFIEMSKEKNQSPLMWSTGQEELLERLA